MFIEGGRGTRAGCSVYAVEKWPLSESSLNEAPAEILVIMSAESTPLEKMPESALSSEVGPFLALTSGSTSVPMPQQARLTCDLTHIAAGARISSRWNGPPQMKGKRIDSFLTPPHNDSAFLGMVVVITAVTIMTVGIIFGCSGEPKAPNANMEPGAVSPDPEILTQGTFPAHGEA